MNPTDAVLSHCKALDLPSLVNNQHYIIQTNDGGHPVSSTTQCTNALEIINNCLYIHDMDWNELTQSTWRMLALLPSIEVTESSIYGTPLHGFRFRCGTFAVFVEGPFPFDEILAQQKRERHAFFDAHRES